MNARVFLNEIRYIYEKCESYLDIYRDAYEGVTPHLWTNSSEDLYWSFVCGSAEKNNYMSTKEKIKTAHYLMSTFW